jgi:enamine deaminase RidA (YjgF/YER057c/UK114 family)
MDNIQASLAKHSLTMNDLVKCTVMLADIQDWPAFNLAYLTLIRPPRYFLNIIQMQPMASNQFNDFFP